MWRSGVRFGRRIEHFLQFAECLLHVKNHFLCLIDVLCRKESALSPNEMNCHRLVQTKDTTCERIGMVLNHQWGMSLDRENFDV